MIYTINYDIKDDTCISVVIKFNLLNKVFILLFLTCILLKQQESFYYLFITAYFKICLIFYLQYLQCH